jgi:hypothetical protein
VETARPDFQGDGQVLDHALDHEGRPGHRVVERSHSADIRVRPGIRSGVLQRRVQRLGRPIVHDHGMAGLCGDSGDAAAQ